MGDPIKVGEQGVVWKRRISMRLPIVDDRCGECGYGKVDFTRGVGHDIRAVLWLKTERYGQVTFEYRDGVDAMGNDRWTSLPDTAVPREFLVDAAEALRRL